MEETRKLSRMTVVMGTDRYELSGGGVTPGVPIPADTVDSEAIIDEAVMMNDLNPEVRDAMITGADRVTQDDLDKFVI